MNRKRLSGLTPMGVFRNLPLSARAPFFSWSAGLGGWKTNLAFNPVDDMDLYPGDPIEKLYGFCETHSGKFMSGYLSFELGYELLDIVKAGGLEPSVPLARFKAYDDFVQFNRDSATCFFKNSDFPSIIERAGSANKAVEVENEALCFNAGLDEDAYRRNFNKIIDYIKAGDIYQINYTHLMQAESKLSGRQLFTQLTRTNPVDYAAYWETENRNIISLSPESFVQVVNETIITKPIKGTRPRGDTETEDHRMKTELLESRKEQAELYMITDLLRNDVGKVSRIGTVKLIHRKKLQKLATVFHTYSMIEGQRREDLSNIEALIAMFPGGSVTGCPKKRAVEIIDEIEDSPRGIYTGSIGYILPSGDIAFNIAIRTVIQQGSSLNLGVGGGITVESDAREEYHETFAKARSFITPKNKTDGDID